MGMFLKIDGIEGGSEQAGRRGQMEVISWSWGMSQSEIAHLPSRVSQSSVQDFSFVKYLDQASPALQLLCLNGQHIRRATLSCTADPSDETFLEIEMDDVVVSSVSGSGSEGEQQFTEHLSLNFAQVNYRYTYSDSNGRKSSRALEWNLRTQKGSVS